MLPFGKLGRPHGVRGEIILRPFGGFGGIEEASLPIPVQLVPSSGQPARDLAIVALRVASDDLLVRFEGITSRETAAALTNAEVLVPRDFLEPLESGEVYIEDLVGCTVVDQQGRERGSVSASFWNGAHDVLTVSGPDGELLVPAVPEFLVDIDVEARRVMVDLHE